jgi:hypothetical protein
MSRTTADTQMSQAVSQAEAEVRRLHGAEIKLYHDAQAAREQVAAAAADLARRTLDAALGDAETAPDAGAAAAARASVEAAEQATREARGRRHDAIVAYYRAHAGDHRSEAQKLRSEADKHEVRTLELLAALEQHEDCKWSPAIVARNVSTGGAIPGTPRTQRLRNAAAALEQQARDLDNRRPQAAGEAVGASVEEVVQSALNDPFVLAPLDEIAAEAQKLIDVEMVRRRKQNSLRMHTAMDAPMVVTVVWREGHVVPRVCRLTVPAVEAVA